MWTVRNFDVIRIFYGKKRRADQVTLLLNRGFATKNAR